ncbi:hypothetical protein [Cryptosporangium sp. NPDC048952]|uniref:hypothetical protein n=1 Tax=Cryptosporangium sp. NPDC048952 TaxID=3363961 RepID=UPI0037102BB2
MEEKGAIDGPSAGRPTPAQVGTEEELRGYIQALMTARTNVRAVAAETGLSKTTVNELRMGRRRVSLDALTKIVGVYAPDEVGEARQAWHRVQPPRRPRQPVSAAIDDEPVALPESAVSGATVRGRTEGGEAPAPAVDGDPGGEAAGGGAPYGVDPKNLWLPVGVWPRALYAVLVVLALVAVADGVRTVVDRWPGDAPTSAAAATPGPCITPAQETKAQLTALPGAPAQVRAAAYHLQRSDPPRLEIAAMLSAPPPPGTTVQLLERADPNTVDSTPEHNSGNGRYYPRPSIRTVGQCVFVPQGQIGYGGFAGIRVRYVVVLLPVRHERTIVADSDAGDGLSEQDLARYSLQRLAYFEFRV